MKREEALALVPGDKIQCADLQACAFESDLTLYEWEVERVWSAPAPSAVRVMMVHGDNRQLVCHNNIAGKVNA